MRVSTVSTELMSFKTDSFLTCMNVGELPFLSTAEAMLARSMTELICDTSHGTGSTTSIVQDFLDGLITKAPYHQELSPEPPDAVGT